MFSPLTKSVFWSILNKKEQMFDFAIAAAERTAAGRRDPMGERSYIAIDLKSFYASVECAERGLDPMTTNLVVADESRTSKTICLAVSPSLKAWGDSRAAPAV